MEDINNSNINNSNQGDSDGNGGEGKDLVLAPQLGNGREGEITWRPRDRPIKSKNKLKPSIIIMRDSVNALWSHVMEIASRCDITKSISTFARRRQHDVCILSSSDTITNVTLHQPTSSGAVVTLVLRSSYYLDPFCPHGHPSVLTI